MRIYIILAWTSEIGRKQMERKFHNHKHRQEFYFSLICIFAVCSVFCLLFLFFSQEWLDFGFELELQNSVLILLQRAEEFFLAVP